MQTVNVFKAIPGMILVREVETRDGRHLMAVGTVLSEKEIRILRMWGILEVDVEPAEPKREKGADSGPSSDVTAFMARWFSDNNLAKPHVRQIHDLCGEWFTSNPEVFSTHRARLAAFSARKKDPIPENLSAAPQILVSDTLTLPTLPNIYTEITAAVNDPKCSGKDIAEIVSKDTSLSATLLKIVNSAFYGICEKVDSLHYAAMALGTRQISDLAMGITVMNYFKGMPQNILDMEAFWLHSLGCAFIARNLAVHLSGINGERLFIGGLLHDIGRLVFFSHFPEAAAAALSKAAKLKLSLDKTEPLFFQLTHAEFGSRLAEHWQFSPEITALIEHHHASDGQDLGKEEAVVYFANWLTTALGIGFSGELILPRLKTGAWECMKISVSALEPVIRQTDRQLKEAVRFFL